MAKRTIQWLPKAELILKFAVFAIVGFLAYTWLRTCAEKPTHTVQDNCLSAFLISVALFAIWPIKIDLKLNVLGVGFTLGGIFGVFVALLLVLNKTLPQIEPPRTHFFYQAQNTSTPQWKDVVVSIEGLKPEEVPIHYFKTYSEDGWNANGLYIDFGKNEKCYLIFKKDASYKNGVLKCFDKAKGDVSFLWSVPSENGATR